MPYREPPAATELMCPRCRKPLLPLDVASCSCGIWVSAFAASEVLRPEELRPDTLTRWWKVRAPCPVCGEKMVLRGDDPGFFQGCDGHGFWIDEAEVQHTGLARGVDQEALERKRVVEERVDEERAERLKAEQQRAEARRAKEQSEAQLAREFEAYVVEADAAELKLWRVERDPSLMPRASTSSGSPQKSVREERYDQLAAAVGDVVAVALLRRLDALERQVEVLSRELDQLKRRSDRE